MNNPFQDQLLKAGLVTKKQVQKANQDKNRNRKKEEQARQKAISIEINQLIENNCLARDDDCEIVYNFEHNNKVKRVYVNQEMKSQIVKGSLGIARIEGRYELVPSSIAEKIQQRNAKRIVIFDEQKSHATQEEDGENDPYSEYQIPDDLIW